LGRSNCDSLSPKRRSNADVMNRGSTDEAVVVVKVGAVDFMVTWMRVKHRTSDRMLEMKGGTCKRSWPLIKDWRAEISQMRSGGLFATYKVNESAVRDC